MEPLRIIMVGDVVGDPGLEVLEARLPLLIKEQAADFVVVNGENAAEGFGLTEACLRRILAAGADVVTSGNHVWEKRDFWPVMDAETRLLRPANYPPGAAGRGWVKLEKAPGAGAETPVAAYLVVNLQGRELMNSIDCPFKSFDAIDAGAGVNGGPRPVILVDFHAESTKEKEALGFYLDGRASLVAGTHTHVQTADEKILPKGTGYITDLGMTGITDSVIGMDKTICLNRSRNQILYRMECAKPSDKGRKPAIQGIAAEIDGETGKTTAIKRISAT
jgi:metallophosphoesterase (TIGR00282 family)